MTRKLRHIAIIGALLMGSGSLLAQAPGSRAQQEVCPLYVPNAFTPNGDNLNDIFLIKHGEDCRVNEFNIKIFDRWGRLVFESNSARESESWNGTAEGKDVQQGVYMYRIEATLQNANTPGERPEKISRQGSVVLMR